MTKQKRDACLQTLIEENCPEIEIVAQAEDVPNAVKAIHQQTRYCFF
jgi:hypothetical protein